MTRICAKNALIYRITHIENVPWLLENGVHCRNSPHRDPNFREIGNPDLISKRQNRCVPIQPGGTLSDYVPFYFTPHSPMLLNIKTGYNGMRRTPMAEIVILVSSLPRVSACGLDFVFTDRHAYLQAAQFSADLSDLKILDWPLLASRDFRRNPNDPGKFERYQAEALIHRQLPVSTLLGIGCYGPQPESRLRKMLAVAGATLETAVKPNWYF